MPIHILETLESSCPIWPDKKIQDTHLLTLIPQMVNGKPLTFDYLLKLIQSPKREGNATKYENYKWDRLLKETIGAKPAGPSHWILMSKDILPNTRGKNYKRQRQELERLKSQSASFREGGYRVPHVLEVAVSILMEYVRSEIRLYGSTPTDGTGWLTSTYCSESPFKGYQVLIGGFKPSGLPVFSTNQAQGIYGLGVAREVPGN